jgi:hypothetical protein
LVALWFSDLSLTEEASEIWLACLSYDDLVYLLLLAETCATVVKHFVDDRVGHFQRVVLEMEI